MRLSYIDRINELEKCSQKYSTFMNLVKEQGEILNTPDARNRASLYINEFEKIQTPDIPDRGFDLVPQICIPSSYGVVINRGENDLCITMIHIQSELKKRKLF